MKFAINYVHGRQTKVMVVSANDADEAYGACRDEIMNRKWLSASLQGACRLATQDEEDLWEKTRA